MYKLFLDGTGSTIIIHKRPLTLLKRDLNLPKGNKQSPSQNNLQLEYLRPKHQATLLLPLLRIQIIHARLGLLRQGLHLLLQRRNKKPPLQARPEDNPNPKQHSIDKENLIDRCLHAAIGKIADQAAHKSEHNKNLRRNRLGAQLPHLSSIIILQW